VTPRPHVLLSVATSIDGYIDDTSESRLLLSNQDDFSRVDEVRAGVDAILVGANTIRRDNPRLLVRSRERQEQRVRRGLSPHPIKVTLTGNGDLDPSANFFTAGDTTKIVYTRGPVESTVGAALGHAATVVPAGDPINLGAVLDDLGERKVERLMVEGGGTIHTQFLAAGLVDEIHLVIAPFLVGERDAPRFVYPSRFPQNPAQPMSLTETRQIGDVVLLRYLTGTFR
jgi:5-amino-6-(5-phosphoribosylamino)uracil reductase